MANEPRNTAISLMRLLMGSKLEEIGREFGLTAIKWRPAVRPEVKKNSVATVFETAEQCYIAETANDSGDEFVSISRARVDPGVTTAWHKLEDITERYIIVSGQGRVACLCSVTQPEQTPVTDESYCDKLE